MKINDNFLDELIREAEEKEEEQTEAFFDILLLNIKKLREQIAYNFHEAEKECMMINSFVLHKNLQLEEKIKWHELKLEGFIRERNVKTIDLPNGTLKMHKKPDKVEIEDLELFLKKAKPAMMTIIPEQVKPDLNKIKQYIKSHIIPPGVKVVEGKEEFSYKLNQGEEENGRKEKTGTGVEQSHNLRAVV